MATKKKGLRRGYEHLGEDVVKITLRVPRALREACRRTAEAQKPPQTVAIWARLVLVDALWVRRPKKTARGRVDSPPRAKGSAEDPG